MKEFKIGRRELYILPTRMGWYFGLIMAALFGIAVKFDNQAAFMMLFLLVAMALIAMIYTHNNVIGLSLSGQSSSSVFVGDKAEFPLSVDNDSRKPRTAIWVVSGGFSKVIELKPNEQSLIMLEQPTLQRGYLNCDPITLTSMYPIGIFFCWSKRYIPSQRCLVYPQPLDLVPLPLDSSQSGKNENLNAALQGNEDVSGMKQYQQGDRIRDIHWPSVAKINKLITVEYESLSPSSVNLSWQSLPAHMNTEDKLSQLCFWVIEAEKSGARYQLDMPNHTHSYDKGNKHFHSCLRTLALWGQEGQEGNEQAVERKTTQTSSRISERKRSQQRKTKRKPLQHRLKTPSAQAMKK